MLPTNVTCTGVNASRSSEPRNVVVAMLLPSTGVAMSSAASMTSASPSFHTSRISGATSSTRHGTARVPFPGTLTAGTDAISDRSAPSTSAIAADVDVRSRQ